jgi:branched-chain amino acid transport system ATP-binding protein
MTIGDVRIAAAGLSAGYGSVPVIHDIDLEVRAGEVVALLGANGAGKTTTLLTLSGELPTLSGAVLVDGLPTRAPLHRRARDGLALVTEERSVFTELTTEDNLRAGRCDPQKALALFPELTKRLRIRGGLLSGGEQQMLTLGRALAREPRVLLADELSLGLAPLVVERLLTAVRESARQQGTAVLLVEQHVRKVLHYADRVLLMQRGRLMLSLDAAEARARIEEIEDSYLTATTERQRA